MHYQVAKQQGCECQKCCCSDWIGRVCLWLLMCPSGLAMKKNWQNRRRAAGLPYDKPNMVMSYSVQVCP